MARRSVAGAGWRLVHYFRAFSTRLYDHVHLDENWSIGMVQHRDLHELLRNLALKSGVEIITGATVVAVHPPISDTGDASCSESGCDPNKPSITLATGDIHQADIVIGADGHRSLVRQAIEGVPDTPITSGKVLYTGTIPFETMQGDEQLREVLEMRHPLWLGNKHYAMCNILILSGASDSY